MASIISVAKYFINLSEESTPFAITPLKLQKLVYYAQGYHLRKNPEPLFREPLLAWDHGPVNRELYDKFSYLKYRPIPKENIDTTPEELKEVEIRTIEKVWREYGNLDGKLLEELTHQEDPWLFTPKDSVIQIDSIRRYFEEIPVTND